LPPPPSAAAFQYDGDAFHSRVPHTVVLDGSQLADIRHQLYRHPTGRSAVPSPH
jgi:hypothetical protein